MAKNRYQLASSTWDDSELQAMQNVIQSGKFTMGERVREFEMQFAAHVLPITRYTIGCHHCHRTQYLPVRAIIVRRHTCANAYHMLRVKTKALLLHQS